MVNVNWWTLVKNIAFLSLSILNKLASGVESWRKPRLPNMLSTYGPPSQEWCARCCCDVLQWTPSYRPSCFLLEIGNWILSAFLKLPRLGQQSAIGEVGGWWPTLGSMNPTNSCLSCSKACNREAYCCMAIVYWYGGFLANPQLPTPLTFTS